MLDEALTGELLMAVRWLQFLLSRDGRSLRIIAVEVVVAADILTDQGEMIGQEVDAKGIMDLTGIIVGAGATAASGPPHAGGAATAGLPREGSGHLLQELVRPLQGTGRHLRATAPL
mmetsp:Transcript_10822/g.25713  ORF Transcript_10822/g.25713 Transcript_10822/m.25713 type:complete len:117 (+) Transcript_10822:333-683(+)